MIRIYSYLKIIKINFYSREYLYKANRETNKLAIYFNFFQ